MKPVNNGPIYVGAYADMAELCRQHGYALAVHGSIARDFDLIAIPWVEHPSTPEQVVSAIEAEFMFRREGEPDMVWHRRQRWTLIISFGEVFCDLQFILPDVPATTRYSAAKAVAAYQEAEALA